MLQNTSKTIGFQKIMVDKTPPGGGGKPYLACGLIFLLLKCLGTVQCTSLIMVPLSHNFYNKDQGPVLVEQGHFLKEKDMTQCSGLYICI